MTVHTYLTMSEDLEHSHDEYWSLMNSKIHYLKCTTLTFIFSLFLCTIITRDMKEWRMGIPVRWLVIGRRYVDDRESSSCIDDNRNTRSGCENKALCWDSNLLCFRLG